MSLALILTAAAVAIICDVLKRNNEQLREMNIELQLRQEQEQKRSPQPVLRVAERPEGGAKPEKPAAERIVKTDKKRTVNAGAMAAMERGASLAGPAKRPVSTPVAPVAESKPEPAAPAPVKAEVKSEGKKDWGSLLSRNAQGIKTTPPAPVVSRGGLQTGFHDGFVLAKLVQSHQPISGLVVSIGVNAAEKSGEKLPDSVSKLVESLIGPNDFAAQSGEDEFLLIYPRESGASAQRRLSLIAQQLWDFQLRSLGSFQILFSWGGVEVQSESIDEAIASASERMQETKRGRKLIAMASPAPANEQLRIAV